MLYQPVDAGSPTRLQGAFISDHEVESLVKFWTAQGDPRYLEGVLEASVGPPSEEGRSDRRLDPLFARWRPRVRRRCRSCSASSTWATRAPGASSTSSRSTG